MENIETLSQKQKVEETFYSSQDMTEYMGQLLEAVESYVGHKTLVEI